MTSKGTYSSAFRIKVIAFVAIAIAGGYGMGREGPRALTAAEEFELRSEVYSGHIRTTMPRSGPWAYRDVLLVPDRVMAFRGPRVKAAVAVLNEIVKGARPEDAALAGGFAVSLVVDPVAGRMACCLSFERFDLPVISGRTPRHFLAGQVESLMNKERQ